MDFEKRNSDFIEHKVAYLFNNKEEVREFIEEFNTWKTHTPYPIRDSLCVLIANEGKGLEYSETYSLVFKNDYPNAKDVYYVDYINSIEVELI